MKLIIYTDGGSRGNPGPAAIGVVVCDEKGATVKKYSEYLGEKTNNEAEYEAVIFALKKVKALYGKGKVKGMKLEIRSDSELMVKHLNHEYKIEQEHLQKLFMQVWNLMLDFGEVRFVHVPRERNKEADRLVNECLDAQGATQKLF
jgi:ribonuclease HI